MSGVHRFLATVGFSIALLAASCRGNPGPNQPAPPIQPAPPTPASGAASDTNHQALALTTPPGAPHGGQATADMPMDVAPSSPLASITAAIAVLHPLGDSHVMGTVTFAQTAAGVAVVADVMGLTPGKHGFHIHEYGDCSDPKGMSAGGHYNPEHEMHGLPGSPHHHPGDMGNLDADDSGHAHLEIMLPGVTIAGDKDPILGRSVIVHVKEDDGSQPTGNAGGRIACGVIGVAKPK